MTQLNDRPLTDKQALISERLASHKGLTLPDFLATNRDLSVEDLTFRIRSLTGVKVTTMTMTRWLRSFGIE